MLSIRKTLKFVAVTAVFASVLFSAQARTVWGHPTVDVAVANWKFTPAKIEAHVGEETTLRFASSEGVHGIQSDELSIPKTTIPPGKVVEVTFTPKKAGTYVIHCAVMCGEGHDKMTLTVEVKA